MTAAPSAATANQPDLLFFRRRLKHFQDVRRHRGKINGLEFQRHHSGVQFCQVQNVVDHIPQEIGT